MTVTATARIYVGTCHKYASGSITGVWLTLEDYADADEFRAACRELPADEEDREFMFQSWEKIPDGFISESNVSDELWDWMALDENEPERIEACQRVAGADYWQTLHEWTCSGSLSGTVRRRDGLRVHRSRRLQESTNDKVNTSGGETAQRPMRA